MSMTPITTTARLNQQTGMVPIKLEIQKRLLKLNTVGAVLLGLSFVLSACAADTAVGTPPPKDFSKPYVERQTFVGKAFYKDNNVWVYTPAFAKTFGMPSENIYHELKGIEAAAFRIEDDGYKRCGMGGKAENCMDSYRCITDIYVDEAKYPLPWATNNQADWIAYYNSLLWLQVPHELGYLTRPPEGVIPNEAFGPLGPATLRPFADPETHQEAIYLQDGNMKGKSDLDYNLVPIYGYKRKAISDLTLISLNYNCLGHSKEKSSVVFRLESRKDIFSKPIKRFHEFQLPEVFMRKFDERLQSYQLRDSAYYQKLFNQPNKK